MNPRLLEISRTRHTWSNATYNVTATPLRFFYPENAEDIQAIVSEAQQEKLRVRAVGSGHSFSEAAKGDDFLLDMKELRNAEKYASPWVKPVLATNHYVLADAGITLRRLNRLLDDMKLALPNMGAVDFQTISGALMTGTHGTGIAKPAVPDMVRSLRIVGKDSELIQIEPEDGITDPVYHNAHSNIRLIQNNDIFYSTVLSFGAMGIVYQLVLEVVPAFWMKEHRYLEGWSTVRQKLLDGTFMQEVHQNDFMAMRVNPYKLDGDHLCSIVVQNIVPEGHAGGRNFLAGILSNREAIIENLVRTVNRNPKNTAKKIQTSLKYSKVKNYVDQSFKVLYQSGAAVLKYGISSEFAFEADGQKIVQVLEEIFKYTEFGASYADRYHPSHIPVRFVMPSEAFLSSAYHRETVYIDVPTLHSTIGDFELLEDYQKMMIKLDGIPHWGKVNYMLYQNHQFIRNAYPKWQTWVDVRRQMDPNDTFINDFIILMGLA